MPDMKGRKGRQRSAISQKVAAQLAQLALKSTMLGISLYHC